MKKIISLLLATVLLFGAFSTVLSAVECEHENTEWQQITDGCALVCTDCGEMLSEEIPHDFEIFGEYTDEEDCELWGCTGERYRGLICTRCGCFGSEWIQRRSNASMKIQRGSGGPRTAALSCAPIAAKCCPI